MLSSLRSTRRYHSLTLLLLLAALGLTAVAYWPSLHGGFVFDDYPNILQNREVHLHSLDWDSLRAAAMSSPSAVLVRPLAMLSFGIDWYFSGGSSFEMKLVNLAIHLINGVLVFLLLRRITRRALGAGDNTGAGRADLLALCVAAAWLLAPINFTAAAYIVQRMESLCQLFVLLGLIGYVRARERMLTGGGGFVPAFASLVAGTVVGALAKESAVLLPLYALIVEWTLFGFADSQNKRDRRIVASYVVLLLIPGCIAAIWALVHSLPQSAWINRPFTLTERLLSEPRILVDYIHWSLLPMPNALALYHDQIAVSRSLLNPPTTLASIVVLLAVACSIPWLRPRRPLAALGIGWFFAAHLLTATIIPLELVFEHRNYFASIGLFLAVFSLLVPDARATLGLARAAACIALLALFASITWIRALDWSNPVAFALSEAAKNPDSPRTAYELGRTYVVLSQYHAASPLVPNAYAALEHAATMPGSDALPDQAILILAARLHQPVPKAAWQRFQHKLASQPMSAQNISALFSLTDCAIEGACRFQPAQMVQSYLAALQRAPGNARVMSIYANYAINVLHDPALAIELAQDVLKQEPTSLQSRRNLMLLLQTSGRHTDAVTLYEQTLRELPQAAHDIDFMKWSDALLNQQPADPASGAIPQAQL